MNKQIIEKLIGYADNDFMEKYIRICQFYQDNEYTHDRKYEFHHIIPSFLFKNEIKTKNRNKTIEELDKTYDPIDNVVKLPVKWHFLAHWFLAQALPLNKEANNAFNIFINDYSKQATEYTREEVNDLGVKLQETNNDNTQDFYITNKDKKEEFKKKQKELKEEKRQEAIKKKNEKNRIIKPKKSKKSSKKP